MARPSSTHPTELELEILKILWRDGPSLAKRVQEEIGDFRDLAYTSVLTIMNIMTKKKYLKRQKKGKSYVYEAVIDQDRHLALRRAREIPQLVLVELHHVDIMALVIQRFLLEGDEQLGRISSRFPVI